MPGRGELPPSGVGPRLRALRESRGLTQLQAAERIGVHVNTIARIEREELEPTAAFVAAASAAFGVDCRALLAPADPLRRRKGG
jgi:transcriptional regulator with XRE-family HTH domain